MTKSGDRDQGDPTGRAAQGAGSAPQSASATPPREAATRHVYGPRPIGALVPAITRPAFRKRAPAAAQVLADWEAIVGPALAAVTVPKRLTSGTLTVGCSGPMALELQHLSEALIGRVNAHLGRAVVERLRFVQEAPAPAAAPVRRAAPSAEATRRVEQAVAELPEGRLREALAALGRAVLTRD